MEVDLRIRQTRRMSADTPRRAYALHAMACEYPEGCSCGAKRYNELIDDLAAANARAEKAEKERDALAKHPSDTVNANYIVPVQMLYTEVQARADRAERWKAEHLTVESWWAKIDAYVRKQTDARLGENVADIALEMLVKSREDSARLDWLRVEPYERLQKLREWLPISYVPPAPDNLRAAIDNAMKHDPNFRPTAAQSATAAEKAG